MVRSSRLHAAKGGASLTRPKYHRQRGDRMAARYDSSGMKKSIYLLAMLGLFAACEQKTTTVNPPAEKKESNTTIVNPPSEKKETNTTVVNPPGAVAPRRRKRRLILTSTLRQIRRYIRDSSSARSQCTERALGNAHSRSNRSTYASYSAFDPAPAGDRRTTQRGRIALAGDTIRVGWVSFC